MIGAHVVAVVVALGAGALVLVAPKGTPAHRRCGWVYAAAIAATAGSSFGIYELRDGPSIFHVVSVATLLVLGAGLAQPVWRRGRDTWRMWHAALMETSYLMTVVTGIAQFFDELPLPSEALNAIVFLQVPLIVGIVAIVGSARRQRPARR